MSRNIVLCADGTGSTFDGRSTNVTELAKHLALDQPERQLVIYDAGVGTAERRQSEIDAFARKHSDDTALSVLDARGRHGPLGWSQRVSGLLIGSGLKQNVKQLYVELAQSYDDDDHVFLFGFSRGAFTVRALAGLLYRCRLPPIGCTDLDERFERSWKLYQPMRPDREEGLALEELRNHHRLCPVHFLGLWDTVKSYGALVPVILPHLRHNPVVTHVRHALALDERRAWFKPTTWGQLDSDRKGALTRVDPAAIDAYNAQDIREVWFPGSHSDIGGGSSTATPSIAFRWMLGEATSVEPALILNQAGVSLMHARDAAEPSRLHSSWSTAWRTVEQVPRLEIDNSGIWPRRVRHRGSDGIRDPLLARRNGSLSVHSTVTDPRWTGEHIIRVATRGSDA